MTERGRGRAAESLYSCLLVLFLCNLRGKPPEFLHKPFDTGPQQQFDDQENEEVHVASRQVRQPDEHEEQCSETTVSRQEESRMQRRSRFYDEGKKLD